MDEQHIPIKIEPPADTEGEPVGRAQGAEPAAGHVNTGSADAHAAAAGGAEAPGAAAGGTEAPGTEDTGARTDAAEYDGSWEEVVASLTVLGDSIGRWAKAAARDPNYERHAGELRGALQNVAGRVTDAVDDVSKSEVAQGFKEAAVKTGGALYETSQRVYRDAVAPGLADAFRGAAEGLRVAAQKLEESRERAQKAAEEAEAAAREKAAAPAEPATSETEPTIEPPDPTEI